MTVRRFLTVVVVLAVVLSSTPAVATAGGPQPAALVSAAAVDSPVASVTGPTDSAASGAVGDPADDGPPSDPDETGPTTDSTAGPAGVGVTPVPYPGTSPWGDLVDGDRYLVHVVLVDDATARDAALEALGAEVRLRVGDVVELAFL
jgi:hypothetical protein